MPISALSCSTTGRPAAPIAFREASRPKLRISRLIVLVAVCNFVTGTTFNFANQLTCDAVILAHYYVAPEVQAVADYDAPGWWVMRTAETRA